MSSKEQILCIQAAIRELKKAPDSDPPSPADAFRHYLVRLARLGLALYVNYDGIAALRNVNTFMRNQFEDLRKVMEDEKVSQDLRERILPMIDEAIAASDPISQNEGGD